MLCLDMRGADNIGSARIDHNQLGGRPSVLTAKPPFHSAGKNGVAVGGICANDQNDVAFLNTVKILRTRAGAKGCFQTIARW